MNKFKMKVNKLLTDELARIKSFSSDFDRGEQEGIKRALYAINSIDGPEKPVLNKYEAEWIEGLKKEQELRPFCTRNSMLYFITRCGFGYGFSYDHKGEEVELTHYHHDSHVERERLMNAFLYGYEVEKERLYTAKLKISDEYLCYDKDYKEFHHFKVPDDVTSQVEAYHFTKDDLIKYHAWDNEAYEVEEVEE